MRPVNLIPPEDRRGDRSELRSGALPYVLLGGLVALFVGVTALVLTENQISERKAEVLRLEHEDEIAAEKAESFAPYTQFRAMSEARVATVASLAESRFDWERVMRELALILPADVWLVELEASAASGEGGGGGDLREGSAGPAMVLDGCATGQEGVARFVSALRDIEGVTRIAVKSSQLGDEDAGAGGGDDSDCRTRRFIARFQIIVAFDAVPVPPVGAAEEAPTTSPSESGTAAEEGG
jgi:hypothetical protein